ncbi:uncharacterized metal-binding protein [Longilinea arvoryzae]|uniref:Uncharacterized metal-binding protein n=2 Tax=Longilinea arvoryzae TaxID=360412 RepID=A0A0S7BIL3_9CHLR|nr:uncharacterized metal-binding protein [Longilinea arvoryzae]
MPAINPSPSENQIRIDLEPLGLRIAVEAGTALIEAIRQAGVEINAVCNGNGTCGACQVRLIQGALSPLTSIETGLLTPGEQTAGIRLACQARALDDCRVEIPPETLATRQRLQVEGLRLPFREDPLITALDVTPADGNAPLSERLRSALRHMDRAEVDPSTAWISDADGLKFQDGEPVRLALRRGEGLAILPAGAPLIGAAVDMGTTKLAAYLVDLTSGEVLARGGILNPQIAYGEDVINRIAYTLLHPGGLELLQTRLIDAVQGLLADLCSQAAVSPRQILDVVLVGNTAIHHLAAGLPVESLGTAPYLPAVTEPLEIPARQIGLSIAPNANGYFPPNIAGFVGADHVAMLLAAREVTSSSTVLAIDIGTNTEVSLFHAGQHYCCSCASGPAFEGAHIHQGMRAAPGAIERVRLEGDRVWVQTVGNAPAVGICGSGVLDAVAELRRQERIDSRGVFTSSSEKARRAFILVPAGQSGNRADIVLTRKDINEIQLAKGAIRSGIDILLETAGIPADRVDQIIIAGAFGTYLNLESALRIGMFPALPLQRFTQVGNAAGAGACLLLASASARQSAREIASKAHYVELTTYAGYVDHFSRALSL